MKKPFQISMKDVKFRHAGYEGDCDNHSGIITIASYALRGQKIVWYGCSFCSPKDSFSKSTGRLRSLNRLKLEPIPALYSKLRCNDVTIGIINNLLAIRKFPSWAENILLLELGRQLVIKFEKNS